jgi:uncharacterized protein (TIGR02145 family)
LRVAFESVTALNPAWAPNRHATIDIPNLDLDAGKGGAGTGSMVITQWAPVLTHTSNNLPAGSDQIPMTATAYSVTVNTNLQGWGVRVYDGADNSAPVLLSQLFGNSPAINGNAEAAERSRAFTIPENTAIAPRTLSVYLYCTELTGTANEIWVGSYTQRALVWARTNLEEPGVFAANPQDFGRWYQWGTVGGITHHYTGTGAVSPAWNTTADASRQAWTADNDPCAAGGSGWRLPTADEFVGLLARTPMNGTVRGFHIAGNGNAAGRCLGPNANATCDGRDTPNTGVMFFPYNGRARGGRLENVGIHGQYWTRNSERATNGRNAVMYDKGASVAANPRSYGFAIRCVRDEPAS